MERSTLDNDTESLKSLATEGKYEETFALLLDRVREFRGRDDQAGVDMYIRLARGILVLVESEFGATRMKPKNPLERSCSFCGNDEESELVAGAEAMLRKKCSDLVHQAFHGQRYT